MPRLEKCSGSSLNQASQQTADVQAFARLSRLSVHRWPARLARRWGWLRRVGRGRACASVFWTAGFLKGARLEIDSGRALQRTAKRNNALPINDFRNNDVHRSVPVKW